MYEGALLVVRPFLAHRPVLQKAIDDGLAEVARTDGVKIQAFRLHEVIEDVRGRLKAELKLTGQSDTPRKPASRKGEGNSITGSVLLDGKPAGGVEVTFVTLDQPVPRVLTVEADANGAFGFPEGLKAGKYVVSVDSSRMATVPGKYHTTGTSGLVVEVIDPPAAIRLELTSK
jgi:hypothetical protein